MTWCNLECPIDDQGHDATWRIVGRLIAREIKAVDLHLSEGGTWRDRIHRKLF